MPPSLLHNSRPGIDRSRIEEPIISGPAVRIKLYDRQATRRSAASRKSTKVQDVSLVLIRARWGLRSLIGSQCVALKTVKNTVDNLRRAVDHATSSQHRRTEEGGENGVTAISFSFVSYQSPARPPACRRIRPRPCFCYRSGRSRA